MNTITPAELRLKLSEKGTYLFLIDVRDANEHKRFNIGGLHIPLEEIIEKHKMIESEKPVIIYCKMGIRSIIAIQRLEEKYGFTNLYNLSGGMDAWMKNPE